MLRFLFGMFALAATPSASLSVPYVSQVPDGAWVAPWDEACEEASIAMVENYYNGRDDKTAKEQKGHLSPMIAWEKETFKTYEDTDAEQTVELIDHNALFSANVVRSPSLSDIKGELADKRPVIASINMYTLYGERDLGDSYHMLVLTGFDDEQKEFILNDPARERSRYSYDAVMDALHDYNPRSKEADGTPTVIFTAKRHVTFTEFWKGLLAGLLYSFHP